VLGYEPAQVPHLVHAAERHGRALDLSDIELRGESIDTVGSHHRYDHPHNQDKTLPLPMEQMGIQGLSYYKYDLSLCTYCAGLTPTILYAIARAWRGIPWNDVEVLSGKTMSPKGDKKKSILFGKCIYRANKDNPKIKEMIAIKGCPPQPQSIVKALHRAGIMVEASLFANIDKIKANFLKQYAGRPEFEQSFYTIK
jgi:Ni,Fe-hydrogenase III small subunit